MSDWIDREKGPTCSCGWPTFVIELGNRYGLMCFFHTKAEGAMFSLPSIRPDDWSSEMPQERVREVVLQGEKEFPPDSCDDE